MAIIDKTDSLCVIGDITYLDINGILPNTHSVYYRFDLNMLTPGTRVQHLIIQPHQQSQKHITQALRVT